ncbi:hypothetical protein EMPS_00655 [Entomortierella parvispora]|uniref:BAG domain-containing protein n=1 Tax=Entomortierella parvispora TaxID=205924 RepID=A0A9P3H1C8_9FUNG|nr:hypothetical protein EMPS_00655 [Entomortierella parvispora]
MYSIFSDPRTAARGSRRPQERRDFFPSFADSFFGDPFSSGVDERPTYSEEEEPQPLKQHSRAQYHQNPLAMADHLGANSQQPHQQQRRQAPRQHQQHQNQEELHHQQHRHQIHRPPRQSHLQQQFQALKQQQERQQPSNGPDHSDHHHPPPMANNLAGQQVPQRKRQGRRQRQRAQQGLTIKPVEAPEATDDMDSLVQAAFGEGAMSSPTTKSPATVPAATWKVHSQPQLKKNVQHGQKHPGHSLQSQQNQRHPGYTQNRTQRQHGQHHPSYSLAQAQSQKPKHQNHQSHHNHKPVETSEEEEQEEEEDEEKDEEEDEEEEEDQKKQQSLDNEDEYPEYSEEEEMKPDPEVQARSNKELAEIRFSLDGLAQELDHVIGGVIPNKKQILMTEENLTKAMLKIDSVDSGGDDSIRKQRKDLVNRAEALLEKVDEFKARTNTHVRTRAK